MAHDIFISYSSRDKEIADAVCAHLESRGLRCWYAPRDIQPGADWAESIIAGLNGARVMVLIYTDFSNESEQVLREVAYAADNGIVIIPFRLSGNKPKERLGTYLRPTHWLDAIDKELAQSIQKLGNRCEAAIRKIRREDEKLARDAGKSTGSRAAGLALRIGIAALIVVVAVFAVVRYRSEKSMDPSDSHLVASIDAKNNGMTMINLVDTMQCKMPGMTCEEYTDAFLVNLKALGGGNCEAVRGEQDFGTKICKGGKPTGFDLVYLDGDNAIINGRKTFCTAGLIGSKDTDQRKRLLFGAALIMTAYPELSKADAKELALVLYDPGSPVHARDRMIELFCQVGDDYSLTILDGDSYND